MKLFYAILVFFSINTFAYATDYTWASGAGEQSWEFSPNWSPSSDYPHTTNDVAIFSLATPPSNLALFFADSFSLHGFTSQNVHQIELFGDDPTDSITFGGVTPYISMDIGSNMVDFICPVNLGVSSSDFLSLRPLDAGSEIRLQTVTGTGQIQCQGPGSIFMGSSSVSSLDLKLFNSAHVTADFDLYVQSINSTADSEIIMDEDVPLLFQIQGNTDASTISGKFTGGVAGTSSDWDSGNRIFVTGLAPLYLLNTNNDFVSPFFVDSKKVVQAQAAGALGASGANSPLFVRTQGALELNPNADATFAKDLFLNGSGINQAGALRNLQKNNTLSGNIHLGWSNGAKELENDVTLACEIDSLKITGVISGSKNLTLTGNGTWIIQGTSPNTFSGQTTLTNGVLNLMTTPAFAIGSLNLNGGSLLLGATNQLASNATLFVNGGSANFQNFNQTFQSLRFFSGLMSLGSGQLSLSSNTEALTMRNTTLNGTVFLLGSGDITFDATNSGSAKILGILNLGSLDHNFVIENGSSAIDMEVIAALASTGDILKKGPGTLKFSGSSNVGNTQVEEGKLIISAPYHSSSVNVHSTTTLGGTGPIVGNISLQGNLSPGESIGTMTVVGNVNFQNGSQFTVELSPTNHDLLDILGQGIISINPGATISILPQAGNYPENFRVTVIDAPGGVSGFFDQIKNTSPLFKVFYFQDHVDLVIRRLFSTDVIGGNPGRVAACLDQITPIPFSDMEDVIEHLDDIFNIPLLRSYLNTMHPAMYKGKILACQKTSSCLRKAIHEHTEALIPSNVLWVDLFSDFGHLKSKKENVGYKNFSPAGLLGFDGYFHDALKMGGTLAYSHNDIDFNEKVGSARVNSMYGALYASFYKKRLFFDAILSFGYHYFHQTRKIDLGYDKRIAKSRNRGLDVGTYVATGFTCQWQKCTLKPFIALDNDYILERGYKEKGAKDLNLHVQQSFYNAIKTELGVHLIGNYNYDSFDFVPDLKISMIKPIRSGSHYTASFINYEETPFEVIGQKPQGLTFALGLALSLINNENFSFEVGYNGEFQSIYQNHMVDLSLNCSF